jgi:uncharacterized protein (TIGR00369 family)
MTRIDERAADSFARQGLMKLIGAELRQACKGRCIIELALSPGVTQQHGYFHAGASSALADTAAGYAALTAMPAQSSVLTVEYKTNLLAPADGELLRASGRVIRAGRTLVSVAAEVECLGQGSWSLCAQFLGTMMRIDPRRERPR